MSTQTNYIPLTDGVSDNTGFAFYNVTALSNWLSGHWEFVHGQASYATFSVRVPKNMAVTPNASIVLEIFANDATAGHTANFQTSDALVSTTLDVGSLASASPQAFTTTSTAYGRVTLTFAVQSSLIAGDLLVVKIATATTGTQPVANMLVFAYLKIDQTV